MKKLTTQFLRENPTGTACGTVGNTALSDPKVIRVIDKYFGGEIFVNDDWDEIIKGLIAGVDGPYGINEISAKIHDKYSHIDELQNIQEKDVKGWFKNTFDYTIEHINIEDEESRNDVIGNIFSHYVELAEGSARYEDGYLDEDGMLFFEVE